MLYHSSNWLVGYASQRVDEYVRRHLFGRAAKWKDRRDTAKAYLELVPQEEINNQYLHKETFVQ
jgi:hypothetical protein